MSNVIVITGKSNSGKTELLTKLYETILRWYDNYELTIEKQPINSFGDFLADITIKRNNHFILSANDLKKVDDKQEDCYHNSNNIDENSIRILINTAGDELENFILLKSKITHKYDFLILAVRGGKTRKPSELYCSLKSKPKGGMTITLDTDIEELLKITSVIISNNCYNEKEKNLMYIMKEIVCYTYNNLN